ncbi:IS256 family transposase [Sphingobacterium sp. BN32]|uniref:IS256 family transposase n=1 Tax=Sphingobacterium sp. BN32 TaxID=3058432 RepID=UPI00265D4169|nr:IS256 family transposase [Sphingobacterium sp. BN32]WKK57587.1 IS256 family transposase [Sphingobacterium sp. BN32]WKK57642.1 IS256 family transposase [Sphingobacterium sp. BN32]WKK58641.1 IS256 family transposase [Sphingobacterium sp. BN32]
MKEQTPFDFERFKAEALQGLSEGKSLSPNDGVLAPLMKHLLESMLSGEMDNHLEEEKASGNSNRRNGKTKKTVRGPHTGTFELETSRDRSGTFEPKIVPKRQLIITEQLEGHVLSMYAKGMSMRGISDFIREMYAMEISATEISRITESVMPAVNEWRSRPLEAVYPFVFLDCMHYKVRQNGTVESRAIYNILGIGMDGRKDLIGLYSSEHEGAKFWLSVLTDLKQRGVEDILIACIDGLKGFPEAIEAIFPKTRIQLCVVHQIRSSIRYVTDKDKREVIADMKPIYRAVNEEMGYENLLLFEEKWGKKYPLAVKSWLENWVNLSTFFEYDQHIRKIIYTTNPIEGMHRQIRKITKTKGAFNSEQALLKLMYLIIRDISKKWTMPAHNWALTISQLYIKFGDRIRLDKSF